MKDPYDIIGVSRTASADEIQKAYRKLAKKHHPDLNPGDKAAEVKFKELAGAYDLLSDPEKRRRFDSGEIDASGAERPRQRSYRDYASEGATGSPYENTSGFADFAQSDEFLAELLRRQTERARNAPGADLHYHLAVDLTDALTGATRRLTMPGGGTLDVTIPAGIREGQVLRLRGKGAPSRGSGPPGDALVEISILPHAFYEQDGDDIRIELPVTIKEALLGAKVKVPTPSGAVMMNIPRGSNSGTVLRLKGKGAPKRGGGHGDELVTLKVVLPEKPDAELETFLSNWSTDHDPRRNIPS